MCLVCNEYSNVIIETLLKMDMEDLIEFLQIKLEQDFGYNDDVAIEALQTTILDLQRYRLHIPGRALPDELPQRPFGLIVKPNQRVMFILNLNIFHIFLLYVILSAEFLYHYLLTNDSLL